MIPPKLEPDQRAARRRPQVTVYGLKHMNSLLTFGVDAGPVPNKTDLAEFL